MPGSSRTGGGDAALPDASGDIGLGVVEVDADGVLEELGSGRRRAGARPRAPAPGARSDVLPRRPRRPPADGAPAADRASAVDGAAAADGASAVDGALAVDGRRPAGNGPLAAPALDRPPVPAADAPAPTSVARSPVASAAPPAHPPVAEPAIPTPAAPDVASASPGPMTAWPPGPPATSGTAVTGGAATPGYLLGAEPAPVAPVGPIVPTRRQRQAAKRLQARKVGRLVRHVDLWSVFKLALLFHLSAFLITLVAGTLLWAVAVSTGVVGDLEGFVREAFALERFSFDGGRIFQAAAIGGLALVGAATVVSVLLAALLNLISDVVGGVRFTVVEEETARPRRSPRRPIRP